MPARLVTIPISHFCEKGRWALHRAGVPYVEEPHLQLVHVAAARQAGGGRTVPVFVADDGEVLADSTDILRWADRLVAPDQRLYPAGELGAVARALEAGLPRWQRLADGRRFLLGDRFTAADLTFAALSAPMLLPASYGSPLPPLEAMPAAAAHHIRRLRSHPAGVFADRLYREERWARRNVA